MPFLRGKNKETPMNAFRSYIRNSTVYMQFFMLIGFALLGAGLMGAMGFLACQTFYGLGLEDLQRLLADPSAPGAAAPLKLLQIFSSIGLFLLPAMVFSQLISPQPETFLRLRASISPLIGLFIIILFVAITPITDALTWLNDQLHLPGFLSDYEAQARSSAENTQ